MWKVREFICKLQFENKYNCYRFIQESNVFELYAEFKLNKIPDS